MNPEDLENLLRSIDNMETALNAAALDAQMTIKSIEPTLNAAIDAQRMVKSMEPALNAAALDAQRAVKSMEPALNAAALDAQMTIKSIEPALNAAIDAQRMVEDIEPALNAAIDTEKIVEEVQPTLDAAVEAQESMQLSLSVARRTLTAIDIDFIQFLDLVELERITDSHEYEYHQYWGYSDWAVCAYVYGQEKLDENTPDSHRELLIRTINLIWFIYRIYVMGDATSEFLE